MLQRPSDDGQTPLTDEEREGLIPAHLATRADLNQWEALNISRAQRWLGRRRRANVLTEDFLRQLHRRMFDRTWRWAGTFRRSDNNISPYAWHSVPVLLRDLIENTRVLYDHCPAGTTRDAALDDIALHFHHELVRIHPWPNGNGRHARLMTDIVLAQWHCTPFTWGGGTDLASVGDARARYLHALRSADGGDYTALIAFCRS
jgi:Fic-DOC domain mobile mystery protein B